MLGRVPLGERRLAGVPSAPVLQPARTPHEEPPHLRSGGHLREQLLDELVPPDLLPEGLPLLRVHERGVQAGLRESDRAGGDRVPPLVDRAHRDQEPLALLADPVLERHDDVVEVDQPGVAGMDAELAVDRPGRQAGHPALQEECGDAAPTLRPIGRGEDQEVIGDVGEADPQLLPVQPIGLAVAAGRRREVRGIRADAGLGEPERRDLVATRLRDQPALLLLGGGPLKERERVQPDMDALDDPERGVGPLQLFAQDREAQVVHP